MKLPNLSDLTRKLDNVRNKKKEQPVKTSKDNDIVFMGNVRDKLEKQFFEGGEMAKPTGFDPIDTILKWREGWLYSMIGIPNSGKSEFLRYLMVMAAMRYNWRFGIFAYEEEIHDYYDALIKIYLGQNTQKDYPNQCSPERYQEAMEFIGYHFFMVYPQDGNFKISNIEANFTILKKELGCNFFVVDPINQVQHDKEYINIAEKWSDFYAGRKHWQRENGNPIYHFVMHPIKQIANDDGNFKIPSAYDGDGGAQHLNKLDVYYCYHREKSQTDPLDPSFTLKTYKVKGHRYGFATGNFVGGEYNRRTGRFEYSGNDYFN